MKKTLKTIVSATGLMAILSAALISFSSCSLIGSDPDLPPTLTKDVVCECSYSQSNEIFILRLMKGEVGFDVSADKYTGNGEIFTFALSIPVKQGESPALAEGTYTMSEENAGYYVKVKDDTVVYDEEDFTSGTVTIKAYSGGIFGISVSTKIDGATQSIEYVGAVSVTSVKSGETTVIPFRK
ncbi:MAG: hypothetical protein ACI4TM_00950 [Candidatus Cryptobacteroides sp.]